MIRSGFKSVIVLDVLQGRGEKEEKIESISEILSKFADQQAQIILEKQSALDFKNIDNNMSIEDFKGELGLASNVVVSQSALNYAHAIYNNTFSKEQLAEVVKKSSQFGFMNELKIAYDIFQEGLGLKMEY